MRRLLKCTMSFPNSEDEKKQYAKLCRWDMDPDTLARSLRTLCQLLRKHYGRKVVLLIDEYDVPCRRHFIKDTMTRWYR